MNLIEGTLVSAMLEAPYDIDLGKIYPELQIRSEWIVERVAELAEEGGGNCLINNIMILG